MHLRSTLLFASLALPGTVACGTEGTVPGGIVGPSAGASGSVAGAAGSTSSAGAGGESPGKGGGAGGGGGGATGTGASGGSGGGASGGGGSAGAGSGGKSGAGAAGKASGGAGGEGAEGGQGGGAGEAGQGGSGEGGAAGVAGAGGEGPGPELCSEESKLVYVLTDNRELYRFDPPALTFTKVGKLDCKNTSTAFSMAVSRKGIAYAVLTDGSLQSIDVKTATCEATPFKKNQQGFSTFGMGFTSKDALEETLFVSDSDGKNLGKIDLSTFALSKVGSFDKLGNARSELTGNSAGELFGAFEGMPYTVAQIDTANAKILSTQTQKGVSASAGGSNFAFAFWGGRFYLFVGPGGGTDVFVYDPIAKTTEKKKSVSQKIVGAGVSTCAPRSVEL